MHEIAPSWSDCAHRERPAWQPGQTLAFVAPLAGAHLKAQGTAPFGRRPADCEAGKIGSGRSLSAVFLSTSGLCRLPYEFKGFGFPLFRCTTAS
jgi:hypothetical protein